MKQTSNAIKFLLAQYRAIFAAARLKDILGAAALAGSLAVSASAGAAAYNNEVLTGTIKANSDTEFTINGTAYTVTKTTGTNGVAITNSDGSYGFNLSGEKTLDNAVFSVTANDPVGYGARVGFGDGTFTFKGDKNSVSQMLTIDDSAEGATGVTFKTDANATEQATLNVNGLLTISKGSGTDKYDLSGVKIKFSQGPIGSADGDKQGVLVIDRGITVSNFDFNDGTNIHAYKDFNNRTDQEGNDKAAKIQDKVISIVDGGVVSFKAGQHKLYSNLDRSGHRGGSGDSDLNAKADVDYTLGFTYVADGAGKPTTLTKNASVNVESGATLKLERDLILKGENKADGGTLTLTNNGKIEIAKARSIHVNDNAVLDISDSAQLAVIADVTYNDKSGGETEAAEGANAANKATFAGIVLSGSATDKAATLKIKSDTLKNFLTTSVDGVKGTLVSKNSVVELSGDLDLGALTYGSGSDVTPANGNTLSGKFNIAGTTTIKGQNLTVSKKLDGASSDAFTASNLSIQAQTLTLGGTSEGTNIGGFSGATTEDLILTNNPTLTAPVTLERVIKNSSGAITGAAKGIISGDGTFKTTLTINGGNYTADGNLTLDSGTITIGGASQSADASLVLSGGKLTLNHGTQNNTITVSGKATAPAKSATLDLTQAEVVANNSASHFTTFNINNGKVLATAEQVDEILKADGASSGSAFDLQAKGILQVTSGDLSLASTQLVGTAGSSAIAFSNASGLLDVANTLTISGGTLNVANINLSANKLVLSNNTAADVTITGGKYAVKSELTTADKATGVSFAGSTLVLGTAPVDGVVTGSGTIGADLTFSGTSDVEVYGTWTAKNLSLNTTALGNGSGSNLTVDQGSSLTVNNLTASTGALDVGGNLVVNGLTNTADSSGTGLNLASGSINLTGNLTFGSGVAEDFKFTDGSLGETGITAGAIALKGGNVTIQFSSDKEFTSDELKTIKSTLFGGTGTSIDGTLNIGDAKIANLNLGTATDGLYDYSNVANVSDVVAGGVTNSQLTENAFYTKDASTVAGTVGAIHVTTGTSATINNTAGFVNADKNGGYFVSVVDNTTSSGKKAADINFSGTNLSLANGGTAGNINLASGSSLKISSEEKQTNLGNISGGSLVINGDTQAGTVNSFDKVELGANQLTAKSLSGSEILAKENSSITAEGEIALTGNLTAADNVNVSATSIKVANGTLTTGLNSSVSATSLQAKDAEISGKVDIAAEQGTGKVNITGDLNIINGGSLTTDLLTLSSSGTINVGAEDTVSASGSHGTLEVNTLNLGGGQLVIDPDFSKPTATAAISYFGSTIPSTSPDLAGIINGSVYVGQNSALGIGTNSATLANVLTPYQNGVALDSTKYGSIVYIANNVTVGTNQGLILTSDSVEDFKANAALNSVTGLDQQNLTMTNGMYLGSKTGLLIDVAPATHEKNAAITFAANDAKVVADGGEIIIRGDLMAGQTLKIFADKSVDPNNAGQVDIFNTNNESGSITIKSENELFTGTLTTANTGNAGVQLEFNKKAVAKVLTGASSQVQHTLTQYATGKINPDLKEDGTNNPKRGVFVDEDGKVTTPADVVTANSVHGGMRQPAVVDGNGTVTSEAQFYKRYNVLLASDLSSDGSTTESVSRIGAYTGAAQSALGVSNAAANILSGRLGMGAGANNISMATNAQGSALWVAPMYSKFESDGMEAGNLGYGIDMNFAGVALGGDYTMANGVRFGAMFNLGSGSADGQQVAANASTDFDFFGFSVYGGYSFGALSIAADFGYTVADNDVEIKSSLKDVGNIKGSSDVDAITFGVNAQYEFATASGFKLTPHAGIRYTRVSMDDLKLSGSVAGSENFAQYDASTLNVFSIPVGITFAKDYLAGDWTIKPSFDLTLTANMGDTDLDSTVVWDGAYGIDTHTSTELTENFTYGASAGVGVTNGNFSLGLGLNYIKSSSTDEYGVNASARFVF